MAFNFYGTYTTGQYKSLVDFTNIQLVDVQKRIKYLNGMLERNGRFDTKFDLNKMPEKYTVTPEGSYGAKLLRAFLALGGDPLKSFVIRTDTVYMNSGVPITDDINDDKAGYGTHLSNGQQIHTQRGDYATGIHTMRLKKFQLSSIKYKREHLEFKIKRAMDFSGFLSEEIDYLTSMIDENHDRHHIRSVESILVNLDPAVAVPGSTSIIQNDQDLFGYGVGNLQDIMSPNTSDEVRSQNDRGASSSSRTA